MQHGKNIITFLEKFKKILPQFSTLELQYVSPELLAAKDLAIVVPGTYDPEQEKITCISSFQEHITVISSKQRPRKISMKANDGRDYVFLLKGHEDLRQDERVMQLFGLVNELLADDYETCKRDLSIQRYSVIPLSHNAGIVGWVPNCDTLHALIKGYRDQKKIVLNIEHRMMQAMAPEYDKLMLMQKVEVFNRAIAQTSGKDLYQVFWLKSSSSEIWLSRRSKYARSLAAMSMVGYILGLGDRHPSNLMLDQFTGKILHIDFGDCFEVAMTRDKFPEKIPFRLTRMLTHALEVSGVEGTFRSICEIIMRVLRENKDSLMAILEAFVHDPLINWRLLNETGENDKNELDDPVSGKINDRKNSVSSIHNKRSRAESLNMIVGEKSEDVVETGAGSINIIRSYVERENTAWEGKGRNICVYGYIPIMC